VASRAKIADRPPITRLNVSDAGFFAKIVRGDENFSENEFAAVSSHKFDLLTSIGNSRRRNSMAASSSFSSSSDNRST
jgi:hypothetical protein